MDITEIHQRLIAHFGSERILSLVTQTRDPWIEVAPGAIAAIADFVRHDDLLAFDSLRDLCAVDYLETDRRKKTPVEPHFEVVYHLFSFPHRHFLKLKARLPRPSAEQPDTLPEIPSVCHIWATANWHEREAFDLVGIRFVGHPHLKRILCAEDWVGHPLRKDYDFPLEYQGIRGR